MNCPKCASPLDHLDLICRFCVLRHNEEAVRRLQHQPLLLVAGGQGVFTVHPTNTGAHIEMFGRKVHKVERMFCGAEKRAAIAKQRTAVYHGQSWPILCEKCREEVEKILAEARAAETVRQA